MVAGPTPDHVLMSSFMRLWGTELSQRQSPRIRPPLPPQQKPKCFHLGHEGRSEVMTSPLLPSNLFPKMSGPASSEFSWSLPGVSESIGGQVDGDSFLPQGFDSLPLHKSVSD